MGRHGSSQRISGHFDGSNLNELNIADGEVAFGTTGKLIVANILMNDGGTRSAMTIGDGNEITASNCLWVSYGYNPEQVAVVNMTVGLLNAGLNGGPNVWESLLMLGGNGGTGVMNQSGGTVTVGPNGVVLGWWDVGNYSQKTIGIYNLNGGILAMPNVQRGSPWGVGKGYFNFNGGTLQATPSNDKFMEGPTAATVQEGGGVIDTNGNDITIAQKLEHGGTAALRQKMVA